MPQDYSKDFAAVFAVLARLNNQVCMNKAYSQILLRELARLNQADYNDLLADVESLHAEYVLHELSVNDKLIKESFEPGESDSELRNQLGL